MRAKIFFLLKTKKPSTKSMNYHKVIMWLINHNSFIIRALASRSMRHFLNFEADFCCFCISFAHISKTKRQLECDVRLCQNNFDYSEICQRLADVPMSIGKMWAIQWNEEMMTRRKNLQNIENDWHILFGDFFQLFFFFRYLPWVPNTAIWHSIIDRYPFWWSFD